eukprot:TRINITY_DN37563_c2_g3_i1.p1 TRINITY_DN37563_c2_g3~~TRINITY_DN37563_c2_g3_i1.p1  ORF type:complete len:1164 (+),score=226.58 TRINITY_DN37563_c2_g3_i1:83-3493(+)
MAPVTITQEGLKELVVKLEKCVHRQVASKGSQVKARSAERDLLAAAESVRDFCIQGMKGKKEALQEAFGTKGDDDLSHMYEVLDSIDLASINSDTHILEDCRKQLDSVKKVLEDIGSLKPMRFVKPLPVCSYEGVNKRYGPGERVMFVPTLGSQALTMTFSSVTPKLPGGLRLNSSSGVISGQLRSSQEIDETTYVVEVSNVNGKVEVPITFAVKVPPPESIEYLGIPDSLYACEAIAFMPVVKGGAAQEWSVEPPLPSGLRLEAKTGRIKGAPHEDVEPADYVVTACNGSGQATVTLRICVVVPPPISLTYPALDVEEDYACNCVLYLTPDVKVATSSCKRDDGDFAQLARQRRSRMSTVQMPRFDFTVEPPLPAGLEISERLGTIAGRPTTPTPKSVYKITARNAGGEVVTEISLAINVEPPRDLEFPEADDDFFVGEPLLLSPEVDGDVTEWTLEPSLSAGLSFDAANGVIQGIPTEDGEFRVTVTARNDTGEVSVEVLFKVQCQAPSGLEYPELQTVYALYRVAAIVPTVSGKVDRFTVTPNLPDGLLLNGQTGIIEGQPTETCEETTYKVAATNTTGSAVADITFAVAVVPPSELEYGRLDEFYFYGEALQVDPQVVGWATRWEVEPNLPQGMTLDYKTGRISGEPMVTAEKATYTVTASNEAGGTSADLVFCVTALAPEGLRYPSNSGTYTARCRIVIEPELEVGVCGTFVIEPTLPDGVEIEARTGIITGVPKWPSEENTYTVTVTNIAGSTTGELSFAIQEPPAQDDGDDVFAGKLEQVGNIVELQKMDHSEKKGSSDWMLWMVHRLWLNDPELTSFDFSNVCMPLPHKEPRIAPKLVQAVATNTNITQLLLNNSNFQKGEGHELANALRQNTNIQVLNIESNNLDSSVIQACAEAFMETPAAKIQQWRFNDQLGCGDYFGRPLEQALAKFTEANKTILKLGCTMHDPHWRRCVDLNLMRNNDIFRRKRKHAQGRRTVVLIEPIKAVEMTLAKIVLEVAPDKAVWEVFEEGDDSVNMLRKCVINLKGLPSKEQLQKFASQSGLPLKFSDVAPLLRIFRTKLLNTVLESCVTVVDTYNKEVNGSFSAWSETNEKWVVEVWPSSTERFAFSGTKTVKIEISDSVAEWLSL